ncbi:hypothetical protein Ahy_Scaffold9g108570 isoform B [Arachis hypogaea]|uniref:Uncharacterized protein n=1 Tax=Arachis hypogaea TaxID=3818 RepID=A0A444WNA6_ARAHY|nr:hypothetical protein Ahy_Scaffold9g108570 isoform B [Arachis hypogaea]
MEPFSISNDEFSSNNLRNNLQCSMTIPTNSKVLNYPDRRASRAAKETISNSKSLTMGKQSFFFSFLDEKYLRLYIHGLGSLLPVQGQPWIAQLSAKDLVAQLTQHNDTPAQCFRELYRDSS